mmetsp:Transcript_30240/g.34722  ORF Transcript_30240/g.34722 Transcript_30240/m.34722 type:complete len:207 (+) Transcript_30240:143-763(+)
MTPNPNLNSRSFVSSSSSSSSFPTINKYAKYLDVDTASIKTTIATKTTALEFSSNSSENTNENKNASLLTSSSSFFYNHDYDDELDQFWKKKKGDSFYDHEYDLDLNLYCKKQRTLFLKRLTFERLYVLKTELGYSRQDINAAYVVVETLRNQQEQLKKATQTRGRGRGHHRVEYTDSDRSFFLTHYNQQARMIINRAVHAPPVRC